MLVCLLLNACCDSSAIPEHTRNLYSSDAKERNLAALALARCGENAKGAVPRLTAMLYDSNVGVQSSAAYALRQIDTQEARDALKRATARRERAKKARKEGSGD